MIQSIRNKKKNGCVTYGHPPPDIWPRIVKQLGMLQVAEQSLNPQSWTCLNIRHAGAWVRSEGMPETRPSVRWCVKCVFPETYGTMQSNPPKAKWNPTRGPSWHSAPSESGQAPRFYVHCALYGSSYIPKCQSFPQTPCKAETWTSTPSPQSSNIYSPPGFFLSFLFNQSPPSSFDLLGLVKRCTFTFALKSQSQASGARFSYTTLSQ